MSDIILDTSISTKDETDSLSYDEWDGLLISEWFEADPGAPVPASSREDEFKFCYQNPNAWKFVTLPKGMNRETAIQILQNEARFQVLFGDSRTGNPHHDKLGRFSSGSGTAVKGDISVSDKKATALAERVHDPDGGFTVNPRSGKDVDTGFAVAIYPDRSKEIPHEIVNKDTIHQYVSDNKDLLRQDGNMVGGWHDPDSGNVWLDVSRVTGNKQEAIDLAKQHNQIAIFDLGSGNSINTGGTGRSSYPFVFTRANPYHDKEGKFASKSGPSSGEPAELKSMGEINAFLRRNGIPPNQTQLTDKKEIVAAKGYASGGAGYINFDEGSSPGYQGINGYLRDPAHFKGTGAEPKIQEAIPRLDSAIARHSLKEPVKVTRIVGQDAFGIEAFPHPDTGVNLAFLSLKKGDIIQDPAYISTSMKSEVSGLVEDKFTEAFPNKVGIKMNITVPAGTNALYLEPFNPFSSHSNASAQELLLGRDSKMRIDDVIDDFAGDPDLEGSSWTLNVTVLP